MTLSIAGCFSTWARTWSAASAMPMSPSAHGSTAPWPALRSIRRNRATSTFFCGRNPGGLTRATVALETLYGPLSSAWALEEDAFIWDIIVPANTTATAALPAGVTTALSMNGKPIASTTQTLVTGTYRLRGEWSR